MDANIFTGMDSYLFTVSLQSNGSHVCAGTIISATIILTSAYCATKFPIDSIKIGSAFLDPNTLLRSKIASKYSIQTLHLHEKFAQNLRDQHSLSNKKTYRFDLALLVLSKAIQLNGKTARAVKLFDSKETIPPGKTAYIVEWSKDTTKDFENSKENSGERSRERSIYLDRIESLNVRVLNRSSCIEKFGEENFHGHLCVDMFDRSVCARSSGGPLVINGRQAGIIPQGGYCDMRIFGPSAFLEIAEFRDWIDAAVKELSPVEDLEDKNWLSVLERYRLDKWGLKKIWLRGL